MKANRKYQPAKVVEAVTAAGGVITDTARILGCSRPTVYSYAREYSAVQDAIDDANESNLDAAETGLAAFMRGDVDGQTTRERLDALKFFLRTKGRVRGYGDRQEIDIPGARSITIRRIPSFEKLSDEQLATIASGRIPKGL